MNQDLNYGFGTEGIDPITGLPIETSEATDPKAFSNKNNVYFNKIKKNYD